MLLFVSACIHVDSNHLLCICEHRMPVDPWRKIPNRILVFSVFYCRYSVFFGNVNTDVGIGIYIFRYRFGFSVYRRQTAYVSIGGVWRRWQLHHCALYRTLQRTPYTLSTLCTGQLRRCSSGLSIDSWSKLRTGRKRRPKHGNDNYIIARSVTLAAFNCNF